MYEYEYAGFRYLIEEDDGVWFATPKPGQHGAAGKDKHLRAAVECWDQDGRPGSVS